jgi:hypothetical protein
MKSAYELAMERLGGERSYSDEQKARLTEIDVRAKAKRAEAELRADTARKASVGDPAKLAQAQDELAIDLRRIDDRIQREKDAVRGG